ncbi:MAG: hypothetical protein AAF668_07445 [Pseudomonadota bacterium]
MALFNVAERDRLLSDPVAFINNAAFSVSASAYEPELFGRPDRLTMVPDSSVPAYRLFEIGDDIGMRRVPHYLIKKAGPRDNMYFDAYIIEYKERNTPITILGTEAQLAFTANMNGCTLGIGSQKSATDALVVTHANSKGKGSQQANTDDQATKSRAVAGAGATLLEPTTYRTNDKMAITFGVRKPTERWRFYYLSYKRSQGRITTYGVHEVTTNQFGNA